MTRKEQPKKGCALTVEFRVRGQMKPELTALCEHLNDAVGLAERSFAAFDARNPWVFEDSIQRKIYVLLDPESNGADGLRTDTDRIRSR